MYVCVCVYVRMYLNKFRVHLRNNVVYIFAITLGTHLHIRLTKNSDYEILIYIIRSEVCGDTYQNRQK